MKAAVAVGLLAALLATGCDGSESRDTTSVAVYFLRDGKVSPVRRTVESSASDARAALASLLTGPTDDDTGDGLTTAIPDGTTIGALEIAGGVATLELRGPLPTSRRQRLEEVAQIVATLTRFAAVHMVRIGGGRAWTRRAIEDQTPQILVESPLPGDRVSTPIRVSGTANVFEATVSLQVLNGAGEAVLSTFTTATSGTGTRGTFETELAVPPLEGTATIVAFEASAEDGSPLHVVRVPIVVG